MLKEEKGMTLVTLVLAIVVLLALAGTIVYLAFGKNGVARETPIVISTQEKNYAENMVKVGLKAVRNEAQTTSTSAIGGDGTSVTVPIKNSEKMDILINLLEDSHFIKESDTVIVYKNNGNTFRITVNLDNYSITKIE